MEQEHHRAFGPFRLDGTQGRLWQGDQAHRLAAPVPGAAALSGGASRPPGDQSGVAAARVGGHACHRYGAAGECARDSPGVGRCGGRAAVSRHGRPAGLSVSPGRRPGGPAPADDRPPRGAPGRRRDLRAVASSGRPRARASRLAQWRSRDWQDDRGGDGAGPPGPGSGVRIARGQCAEHYGEGEPYLPLLEALGQLCRGPRHPDVLAVLRRYAPLWLVQLLGVLSEAELERLQRQVQGATAARMLRELAEALDVLTAERAAGAGARRPAVE